MIEVAVPNDILKYETKLIGPLTKRETFFGGISLVVGYITYQKLHTYFSLQTLGFIIMLLVMPFLACGFCPPICGLRLEEYVLKILKLNFEPQTRTYQIKNQWRKEIRKLHYAEKNSKSKDKKILDKIDKSYLNIDEKFESSMEEFYQYFPEKRRNNNMSFSKKEDIS